MHCMTRWAHLARQLCKIISLYTGYPVMIDDLTCIQLVTLLLTLSGWDGMSGDCDTSLLASLTPPSTLNAVVLPNTRLSEMPVLAIHCHPGQANAPWALSRLLLPT